MTQEDPLNANSAQPYFTRYLDRKPPHFRGLRNWERSVWHFMAGMTLFFGAWYLHWRWTESLNPDAMVFSIVVVSAETATYLGTCIFFFDIWDERDTATTSDQGSFPVTEHPIAVDIFIASLDESTEILAPTIDAAMALETPKGVKTRIWFLDDGARDEVQALAQEKGIGYFARRTNRGFKAGNLANALYQTHGDFVVICDADTQLFPSFLRNTLNYFDDPKVAWVQTPHWFFDIPEGETWAHFLLRKTGRHYPLLGFLLQKLSGRSNIGQDPFLSDPSVFFDVIQRRRNRHNASFCCGAASIHRRDALFQNSLAEISKPGVVYAKHTEQQPFKFHVSEDICTSIQLHRKSWKSVYHPQIEARMLSPWSADAWAAQKHKYAGGTLDIMLWANPIFKQGLPLKTKLHYLATFWSYASIFWVPILLLAPAFSLATGLAPIDAYTITFFAHLLPVLFCNEVALAIGTKGYDTYSGRCLSMGTLITQAQAFFQVARGLRPQFKPTPKKPGQTVQFAYARPNLILISILVLAAVWGTFSTAFDIQNHSASLLVVNLFWISCNILLLAKTVTLCLSVPAKRTGIGRGDLE